MNQQQQDELISILWKLKNAAGVTMPQAAPVRFHDLLHDKELRTDFIERAANSPYSEIRHVANKARELNARALRKDRG